LTTLLSALTGLLRLLLTGLLVLLAALLATALAALLVLLAALVLVILVHGVLLGFPPDAKTTFMRASRSIAILLQRAVVGVVFDCLSDRELAGLAFEDCCKWLGRLVFDAL
jgi:hypothetical protein